MIGIIGGTGLEDLALSDSHWLQMTSPWGQPSSDLLVGALEGTAVAFINRHGRDHQLPPHKINYRANIDVLAQRDVRAIIAVNAVGGIDFGMPAGSLVVPDQLIDYTWGREHSYWEGSEHPVLHVDFTSPYDVQLRTGLLDAAQKAAVPVINGGVHGIVQGPRLESAAEIRRMEQDGCQLVGMTGMPEAGLAREKKIPYVCLALVVNPAAGKSSAEITLDGINRVMAEARPRLYALLGQFCRQWR